MATVFDVENAGCSSCAERVHTALAALASVESVVIDEVADIATVRLVASPDLTLSAVNHALDEASADAGHTYRVKPSSWDEGAD